VADVDSQLEVLGRERWPVLFSPHTLRGRTVRNRIVSTPHSTGWGHDGLITAAEVDYHVRKAEGGCGLVMTFGSASVDPHSAASYGSISLWDERNDAALRALGRRVHDNGALVMSQMTHMGRRGNSLMSGVALKAVSDRPEGVHREVPAVLTESEIGELVERFAISARRLMNLGWDGAEVTSLGGHLIEQFFDPLVNDRTDRYGGSLENRVRFAREVLSAVREATSDDFLISFRMTADQSLPDGVLTPADLREIAQAITAGGAVDVLSICNGTGYTDRTSSVFVPGDEMPLNTNGPAAGLMRKATGVPVLVAGRILDAAMAERALTEDGVDFVAMTRALIADPDLPRKAARGEEPRPCISLNEGCIGRLYQGRPMWCSVNPAIREPDLDGPNRLVPLDSHREPAFPTSSRPARVVVVGGGVAGAEAAYRAASVGSDVTLFERSDQIGGRARIAGRRPGRERWGLYISWLSDQIASTGVDLRLDTAPSVDEVLDLDPDAVLIASGSVLRTPDWAAASTQPVLDADAVAARAPAPPYAGAVALVVDEEGGFIAPTAAEALVAAGWTVRLITSLPSVAAFVDPTQVWFVRRRLKLAGVELVDSVTLQHDPNGWSLLDVESDVTRSVGPFDVVAVAGARRALDELSAELQRRNPDLTITRIGDALAPRTLLDAVAEGARAGRTLQEQPLVLTPATASANPG